MNKPTPFGKYYLLDRISVGGMAEVFKAKTVGVEGFERIVALKRILPSIAEDEEFITMFIDEAKIAVQLQHANIAQIFDLGKVEDSYFIALEYVNGRDLRSIFEELRKMGEVMPLPQVCYLVMQLCEGLDYAHNKRDTQGRELNLVHRDVSPQNVLVGYEGEVKLIDFGIAKAAGKASKTQAGILKGKFGYMSPEQVRGLPIDRRSDIFALGIVLYELLTGERLFIGESDFSTLEKVRNVEIIPPSSFNADIPEKLESIVLKALEKNVEDRYQNAIDLHDDLQLFLHSVGQFSSRKDLSGWMKRAFAADLSQEPTAEEDDEDIEEIEDVEVVSSGVMPAVDAAAADGAGEEFGWDEEERETQIYDKEPASLDPLAGPNGSFLTEGGEKTVAMEPSEALLAEMEAAGAEVFDRSSAPTQPATPLPTPLPAPRPGQRQTQMGIGRPAEAMSLPAPGSFPSFAQAPAAGRPSGQVPVAQPGEGARAPFDLPKPVFRQTLIGAGQVLPGPGLVPTGASLGGPAYPTYQPMHPTPGLPSTAFPGATFPGAPVLAHPPQFTTSGADLYSPPAVHPRSSSRFGLYFLFVLLMIAGGVGTYIFVTRAGMLQISVRPQDARLAVDGVLITAGPPFQLTKKPGVYRLSVSRSGYVTRDQVVQISAGQAGHMDIVLEPSSDTGFDLTSQPSGQLVWLDGQPLAVDEHGKQATTNFHASRIAPGPHVIEVKGNPAYEPWRQEFLQEPGRTVRLHANLVPIAGAGKSPGRGSPSPAPVAAPPPTPPAAVSGRARERGTERPRSVGRRSEGRSRSLSDGEDIFENVTKPARAASRSGSRAGLDDEDIFETVGSKSTGDCVATISSKPWAEVSIDGKPTGKITPLVNYPMPCGKHRLTFKNADLMIERNERVTLRPGQPFKKIFSLVENEL